MSKPRTPETVQAVQLLWDNRAAVCEFLGDLIPDYSPLRHNGPRPADIRLPLPTRGGYTTAVMGDWIISDGNGKFRLCKPGQFRDTYEPVEETADEDETGQA